MKIGSSNKLLKASLCTTIVTFFLFNSIALTSFASSSTSAASVPTNSYQSPTSEIRNVSSTTLAGWVGTVKTGSILRIHATVGLPADLCNSSESQGAYFYIMAKGIGIEISAGVQVYCQNWTPQLTAVATFSAAQSTLTLHSIMSGTIPSTIELYMTAKNNQVLTCVGATGCLGAAIYVTEPLNGTSNLVTAGWLVSTNGSAPLTSGRVKFSYCHIENSATYTWHSPAMLGQLTHYTLVSSSGTKLAIAGKLSGTPHSSDFYVKLVSSS